MKFLKMGFELEEITNIPKLNLIIIFLLNILIFRPIYYGSIRLFRRCFRRN
ncbi:hypothetical protein ES705_12674 [subsurface metagenome]